VSSIESRFLIGTPEASLRRPLARIQPIQAKEGTPNIDTAELMKTVDGIGVVEPTIAVKSPEHWLKEVRQIKPEVDALIPISVAALPTEVWNSHPQALVEKRLPVLFWPLTSTDEPDMWRWSASDMLRALGVEVRLIKNSKEGLLVLKALAVRRQLKSSAFVVFGEQNFPWNANAVGHLMTEKLGTRIVVRPISDIQKRYERITQKEVRAFWEARRARYTEKTVRAGELDQGIRTCLAIRSILLEERALGFGVNCYGDLLIKGDRDVPCLAQNLLREDGYIAACDGDFCTMMGMALVSLFLDAPCLMSNLYPVMLAGALMEHFRSRLAPDTKKYPKKKWKNLARIGHCGFVGVVSPEMTPSGKVLLKDFGGTYEIKRDGRGCGIDGALRASKRITIIELSLDGKTLLVTAGKVCETTRHKGLSHVESTGLLEFDDLEQFIENISREHVVICYGDHRSELVLLAEVLGLECKLL
jgi:L-fucose isomerase-like protein